MKLNQIVKQEQDNFAKNCMAVLDKLFEVAETYEEQTDILDEICHIIDQIEADRRFPNTGE